MISNENQCLECAHRLVCYLADATTDAKENVFKAVKESELDNLIIEIRCKHYQPAKCNARSKEVKWANEQ